ncbi:flagellar assembly protein FliW [Cohnella sp.]|uniref:flagellar assembly protein FliW n=1 Tax=Cohnella sp. TaxID=1883426 RepID=UPI00356A4055
MKLNTARFGELEVREEDIIQFSEGIPGFEQSHRFMLIVIEEQAPLAYLQSVDDGELAFIVIDPFEFFPNYEFELPELAMRELQIESTNQIIVRTIVSVTGELELATANLVAPVVINNSSRSGKQLVLSRTDYTTRHRLLALDATK